MKITEEMIRDLKAAEQSLAKEMAIRREKANAAMQSLRDIYHRAAGAIRDTLLENASVLDANTLGEAKAIRRDITAAGLDMEILTQKDGSKE